MNIKTIILIGALTLPIISCNKTEDITEPGKEQNDNNNSDKDDEHDNGNGDGTENENLDDDTPASDGYVDKNVTGATINYEIDNAISGWFTDTWATSVVTENNEIYAVYVNNELKPHVCKIDKNNKVSDIEIEKDFVCTNNQDKVDGHDEFCISLDKNGYIHILGNMHNGLLRYWRSKTPYNITDGFIRRPESDINGRFSYYYFRKSQKGELFMSARASTKIEWWLEGGRGIGLYKYNCETQKWEVRGALSPEGKYPVIYFEKLPKYHVYTSDFRFDKNDRLHFTVLSQVVKNGIATSNAIYAYSDDYGITWNNSEGKISTLPMGISSVDIVEQFPDLNGQKAIGEGISLLIDKNNTPAIVYSVVNDNKTKYAFLKDGKWHRRVLIDGTQLPRTETLYTNDALYIIESFQSDRVWKLKEFGQPAECFGIGYSKTRWDHEAWKKGIFRFTHWDNNVWKVVTIPSF